MSKTVDLQIEKSEVLIQALRKRLNEVAAHGFTAEMLDKMAKQLEELRRENKKCEDLRAELSKQVKASNEKLQEVKDIFKEKKDIIKGFYPQERWADYGVMDKR